MDEGEERGVVERRDVRRILRRDREHESRAAVRERQQRDRPVVGESFVRGAVQRAFGRDGGDEDGLPVILAVHADAERRTHERLGAVGGDDEARVERLLSRFGAQHDAVARITGFERDHRCGREPDQVGARVETLQQRIAEFTRGQHRAEIRQVELRRFQPDAAEIATPRHMDAPDRRGGCGEVPHAEAAQCIDAGTGQREIALVGARVRIGPGRLRLGQRDPPTRAIERDRETGTDQSTADDEDIERCLHARIVAVALTPRHRARVDPARARSARPPMRATMAASF